MHDLPFVLGLLQETRLLVYQTFSSGGAARGFDLHAPFPGAS
jgi:hypothetical protein